MSRRTLRLAVLFVGMVLTAAPFLGAQGRVYRERVEPHWNEAGTRFWYRNELPGDSREFVLVDAETGTRGPAFDHAVVARGLSEITGRAISSTQLPVDSLEFRSGAEGDKLLLTGSDGRFLWDPAEGTVVRLDEVTSMVPRLFLPLRPSGNSSEDVEFEVVNQLDAAVKLVWVSGDGEQREYATLAPGQAHRQHSYSGHVWMFVRMDGTALGCLTAGERGVKWTLTEEALRNVQRREGRRGRRGGLDGDVRTTGLNGNWQAFVRDHNLWLKSTVDASEFALSQDGVCGNTFRRDAQRARAVGMDYAREDYPEDQADVIWSPDGAFLIAFQTTQVAERRVYYVESGPKDQLQPKLQSYPYLKPGDPIPVTTPRLFRMSDRSEIPISRELFPNPWSLEFQGWSGDGKSFRLLYNERGHQKLRLLEVSLESGAVRVLIDEQSPTFIHYSSDGKFELRWLSDERALWASERSGWNHLYCYDLKTGQVRNAVTQGAWNVRRIERIDEAAGWIWFYAVGIVPGQDPYHEHFCRASLDGAMVQVLTEGDGTHQIEWSPDRRWFLDRYSRVDLPPLTELRKADGGRVCELEQADATEVLQARGSFPERFQAVGRDGTTMIYGLIHRPKDFQAGQSYAVIENIYAGPHDHHVPKEFRASWGHQQRIADLGFIVVQIDGMGTAWRSKAFHDVCYRNLKDAGFPDRIEWMRAAAVERPQMDLSRVGIYGGSAGGQNAMAALLWHGDFYDAAVADCGCHDNRMDKIWWNEQWMGIPEGDIYAANSNMENAHLLKGQLMLVVGELDRNVDPATTTQVAGRLVQAGHDFELVVVPGAGHGACETPWASRRRAQFFERTLGGPKAVLSIVP